MTESYIYISATIIPAPGKEARLKELFLGLVENVKKHEPTVIKYQLFEHVEAKSGKLVFVVQEIYPNQAALDAHRKTNYFQALGKTFAEEELLAAPPDVKEVVPVAGFASRL